MKSKVLSKDGKSLRDVELPKWFSEKVREDISQKYFELSKSIQPYGTYVLAGRLVSATGKLSHRRHKWKTTYGHGISRVPRKIMWRRGDQFYWIGAGVSGTKGGRRAHPPRPEQFINDKKINKKEKALALQSGFIASSREDWIKRRYSTINKIDVSLPIVVESSILKLKTKEIIASLKKIMKEVFNVATKKKVKRSGRGKRRKGESRKTAGLLLIVGKNEDKKINVIDVRKVNEIEMKDLFPLGRLVVYTEEAIKDLKNLGGKNV